MKSRFEYAILSHFHSKENFARALDISRWTAYRWIKNPKKINLEDIRTISHIMNTDIQSFID